MEIQDINLKKKPMAHLIKLVWKKIQNSTCNNQLLSEHSNEVDALSKYVNEIFLFS